MKDFELAMTAAVRRAYEQAEGIARERMPHLYRVARLFPDRERFLAFCALYASMRWIDDRVDDGLSSARELERWEESIDAAYAGDDPGQSFGPALVHTFAHFQLSPEPWRRLREAMSYDLGAGGFAAYEDFLDYAEGATVAPASIFATLLLMRPEDKMFRPLVSYENIRDAVRPAAVACYEIHILRDAKEDLAAGRNYFPGSELRAFRLNPHNGLTPAWRPYLRAYGMRVRGGWIPALESLESLEGDMTERERLMLHVLVEFYGQSLAKISRLNYDVWSDIHWPEPREVAKLLADLALRYEPGADLRELAVKVVEDV